MKKYIVIMLYYAENIYICNVKWPKRAIVRVALQTL